VALSVSDCDRVNDMVRSAVCETSSVFDGVAESETVSVPVAVPSRDWDCPLLVSELVKDSVSRVSVKSSESDMEPVAEETLWDRERVAPESVTESDRVFSTVSINVLLAPVLESVGVSSSDDDFVSVSVTVESYVPVGRDGVFESDPVSESVALTSEVPDLVSNESVGSLESDPVTVIESNDAVGSELGVNDSVSVPSNERVFVGGGVFVREIVRVSRVLVLSSVNDCVSVGVFRVLEWNLVNVSGGDLESVPDSVLKSVVDSVSVLVSTSVRV
jgi:hypothetical protein